MRPSLLLVLGVTGCWPLIPGGYDDHAADTDTDTDADTDADADTDVDTDTDVDGLSCPSDDVYEDNDDWFSAVVLSAPVSLDAIACPDDFDHYAFDVDANCVIDVSVGFTHADGDLDAALIEGETTVTRSESISDDEALTWTSEAAGTYQAVVYGFQAAQNTYTLDIDLDCTSTPCVDDGYEDNDQPSAAVMLTSPVTATTCNGDPDWFEAPGAGTCLYTTTAAGGSGLALDAYDMDVNLVDGPSPGAQVSEVVSDAALLYLVTGPDDLSYEVSSSAHCPSMPFSCPSDDGWEPNDTQADAVGLAWDVMVPGAMCADSDYYEVWVSPGCDIDVTLTFLHAVGDLDMSLYDGWGGLIDSSAGVTDTEVVEEIGGSAGPRYVRVYGYAGATGIYDIVASQTCP